MTPADFATRLQELRTVIADQATELDENPRWGGSERVEILHELEQLVDQLESLIETLEEEPDAVEAADED
jgi:hypothetical protein